MLCLYPTCSNGFLTSSTSISSSTSPSYIRGSTTSAGAIEYTVEGEGKGGREREGEEGREGERGRRGREREREGGSACDSVCTQGLLSLSV